MSDYYDRWAGSDTGEALQVGVDEYSAGEHNKLRRNVNAAHARGAKGGPLGGSRSEGVLSASAIEAPNYIPFTIDWDHLEGLSVVASFDVKTDDAGTSVTPRIRDVTTPANHDGTASTSTSWARQTITLTAPVGGGVVEYWFYLVPQNATNQVFGIGWVEVFDELSGVA